MGNSSTGMGVWMAVGCIGAALNASAQSSSEATTPEGGSSTAVVVTATRIAQPSFNLPASVDRVEQSAISRGQLQVNLSESLINVAGVSAQSRQNYAQDLQLSVRGFGARASFGVRGVRLYADGVPGTMPDGQGQFSQFDLGSADHIEVLRGPFSALYGNSSGGVIAIFTQDAPRGFRAEASADYGTFDTQRYSFKSSGAADTVNYVIDAAHFSTGGYRDHSQSERNNFNSKVRFEPGETSTLTVVGNAVQTPFVDDPLGLTRAQVAADPAQAGVNSQAYNARKDLAQEQLGLIYDDKLSAADTVAVTAYTGHRTTEQFQAIPKATQQAAPLYPGAVIDLSRAFWGLDAHIADMHSLGAGSFSTVAGITYDDLAEDRKGYANYQGVQLGVAGALRRDEANHVRDFDQYLQLQGDWPRWLLVAGVRNNAVEVSSQGHLAVLDGTYSSVRYGAVNPVAGVTFKASPVLNIYGSYGKGFETPTLNDLAYRSIDGSLPGLNESLRPARSDNYELGMKAGNARVRADLAAFSIRTKDELAVLQNSSGRSVEQNISRTARRGFEAGISADAEHGFNARLAYSYLHATVTDGYFECTAPPCNPLGSAVAPNYRFVGAGRRLPAVPQSQIYASGTWSYTPWGFAATVELLGRARIFADDRNSDYASGYWVSNVRAGFDQDLKRWHVSEFVRLDNWAGRTYVGSVIVNESNSRFFEPAPGRTGYVMFKASWRSR